MKDLRTFPSFASLGKEEKRQILSLSGTTTFYIYAYLRQNGTPFYVGKGCKRRCTHPQRSVKAPPHDRIVFIATGLTEEKAFELEIELIAEYGRKDIGTGILLNFTDGGEGMSGYRCPPETAKKRGKKISKAKKGAPLPDHARKNLSELMKGKRWYTNGVTNRQEYSHPGEGWTAGRTCTWLPSPTTKGKKWYSKDGVSRLFDNDPGDGWEPGRVTGIATCHRTNTGKKWYNNGAINRMFDSPPGGDWNPGMLRR